MTPKKEPYVFGRWISAAAIVITVPLSLATHLGCIPKSSGQYIALACLIGWAIAPPVWFWWEWNWHVKNSVKNSDDNSHDPRLEQLKDGQAFARAIWAGVYALLATIYLRV